MHSVSIWIVSSRRRMAVAIVDFLLLVFLDYSEHGRQINRALA
jgi:hypothetical protein